MNHLRVHLNRNSNYDKKNYDILYQIQEMLKSLLNRFMGLMVK